MSEYDYLIDDFEEVLFTKNEIVNIVESVGKKINSDFQNRNVVFVGILKGSLVFLADLVREIKIPCTMDFMEVSSYAGQTQTTGKVNILKDISDSVFEKDVIIVEDIIDTGLTLDFITKHLKNKGARSVSLCTLLNKPKRRKVNVHIDYKGVDIPDKFVVGYGMDYDERYRNIPFIGILKKDIYSK